MNPSVNGEIFFRRLKPSVKGELFFRRLKPSVKVCYNLIRGCIKSAFDFNNVINIVLAPTGKPVGYKGVTIF